MTRATKQVDQPGPWQSATSATSLGPAGSALGPLLTGVFCDFCKRPMKSGTVQGGLRSCTSRRCQRKLTDRLREEAKG